MRLEATNKNVRGGLNKPPPLPGRVKEKLKLNLPYFARMHQVIASYIEY